MALTKVQGGMVGSLPAGSIVQVVTKTNGQGVGTAYWDTTSTTYADVTNMSLSITPTSSTNKILVIMHGPSIGYNSNTAYQTNHAYKILRDSTKIYENDRGGLTSPATNFGGGGQTFIVIDSPATTSSVTYKLQGAAYAGAGTPTVRWGDNSGMTVSQPTTTTITLMEVVA